MSTEISGQIKGASVILLAMPAKRETLGAYLTRYMDERGIKPMDIQRLSAERGEKIWNGYIYKVLRDEVDPGVKTLQKLCRYIGCPEEEAFAAARGFELAASVKYSNKFFADIEKGFRSLSPEDQQALAGTIDLLQRDILRRLQK